jgi:hypothetical protein
MMTIVTKAELSRLFEHTQCSQSSQKWLGIVFSLLRFFLSVLQTAHDTEILVNS